MIAAPAHPSPSPFFVTETNIFREALQVALRGQLTL